MFVRIKETGCLRELTVYDLQNNSGIEWTADFIQSGRYLDDDGVTMSAADYRWWQERIAEYSSFFDYCEEQSLDSNELLFSTALSADDVETFYSGLLAEARALVESRSSSNNSDFAGLL